MSNIDPFFLKQREGPSSFINNIHMLMRLNLISKIEKPHRISHISKVGMDAFLCKSIPIAFHVRGDINQIRVQNDKAKK